MYSWKDTAFSWLNLKTWAHSFFTGLPVFLARPASVPRTTTVSPCSIISRGVNSLNSYVINGHPTSLRLESEYWYWLRQIAAELQTSVPKLIEGLTIAKNRTRSLSSALRVFVAGYFHDQAPRYGLVDPESKMTFRFEKPKSRKRGVTPRDAMITAVHRLQSVKR
jgi:predicted DNA-binding ribbon-helix-helix protein